MRLFGLRRPGVADAVTIANGLCGAAALAVVIGAPWGADAAAETATLRIVSLLVLAGVVFDVCDGAVARAFGGTPLGPHLDALADAVTFGLATGVAVGGLAMRHATGWEIGILGIAVLAYLAAALVRLADFVGVRSRDAFFTGMPAPLAAVAALSLGLLGLPPWVTAAGLALVALLMVSGVRFPRSRGKGLIAEAVGLAVGVLGILGVIDVRLPAALALVGCTVVAPAVFAVAARQRAALAGRPRRQAAPAADARAADAAPAGAAPEDAAEPPAERIEP